MIFTYNGLSAAFKLFARGRLSRLGKNEHFWFWLKKVSLPILSTTQTKIKKPPLTLFFNYKAGWIKCDFSLTLIICWIAPWHFFKEEKQPRLRGCDVLYELCSCAPADGRHTLHRFQTCMLVTVALARHVCAEEWCPPVPQRSPDVAERLRAAVGLSQRVASSATHAHQW